MSEKITVKAEVRDTRGKGASRRMRAAGQVPVVVYGGGGQSVAATARLADLAAVLRTDTGTHTVFTLDIAGEGVTDVIFQDRQIDPVKGRLLHADLRRLVKGERIEIQIPIQLVGEAEGMKEEGAVLSQTVREIKILVDPASSPDFLEVDISTLSAGHSLHVSDIKVPSGMEILEEPDTVIASIVSIKESELEPQLETAEPEVVGGGDEAGE